ncbi:MAG: SgrR family transcriptional regulator, partial [Candidatus Hadarchaeum sp.]|uniref:SgrR family transcriptional regulator n=1 Tax=Candidatus Hadarchaeum sp. TaxID=2883567 RepID=UPI00316F5EF0
MLACQILGWSDAAVKSVVPARPDVLRRMPSSCNRVFDLLMLNVHDGKFVTSLRELASAARLSPCQVHRALRRLEGAHLIRWERRPGRGHRSQITLLWPCRNTAMNPGHTSSQRCSPSLTPSAPKPMQSAPPEVIHSQEKLTEARGGIERENRNVSPYARDTLCPRETKTSHTGEVASALPLGPRALAWAMAQVRNDLRARPSIDLERRAAILGALGAALQRAVRRKKVRTRRELSCLVGFILARLEERRGLGLDLGATRRWAEWCVREGLRRV